VLFAPLPSSANLFAVDEPPPTELAEWESQLSLLRAKFRQVQPRRGSTTLYTADMDGTAILERTAFVRRGRRLEYFTVAWNALEGLVAVFAGVLAGSISLVGFGVDSFIRGCVAVADVGGCGRSATRAERETRAEDCRYLLSRFGCLHHLRIGNGFVVQEGR